MGSGCTTCNTNKWPENVTADTSVRYTGDAIPELGICTGDKLNEIEEVILNKILEFMDGQGITLSSLTISQCDFIKSFMTLAPNDKSLLNSIDVILQAICALNTKVEDLKTDLTSVTSFVYDLKCLTVDSPTTQKVVQALIDEVCTLKTQLTNSILISEVTDIVVNQLVNSITACTPSSNAITVSGTGTDTKISINALVPPYTPIWSYAGVDNFDSTGKGIPEKGFCGWYICNGLNGTKDLRGWKVAGANSGVPGPALIGNADPAAYPNTVPVANVSIGMQERRGEFYHENSVNEMPFHRHPISQGGHAHNLKAIANGKIGGAGTLKVAMAVSQPGSTDINQVTDQSIADIPGFETEGAGGGFPHNNVDPTVYGIWIMRIN